MLKNDRHGIVFDRVKLRNKGPVSAVKIFDADGNLIRIENKQGKIIKKGIQSKRA